MKVILLNGPPRVGKDTGAKALAVLGVPRLGLADELKRRTHALYGLPPEPFDRYEALKAVALDDFLGLTPRQAYIEVAERHYRRLHGPAIFGRLWLERATLLDPPALVAPDAGFAPECQIIADVVGRDNTLLVRVRRDGLDFTGDSRGYISLPGVRAIDLENPAGQPEAFLDRLLMLGEDFID